MSILQLINSVSSNSTRPRHLESATYHIASKLKKGGPGGNLGAEPQLHIGVLVSVGPISSYPDRLHPESQF